MLIGYYTKSVMLTYTGAAAAVCGMALATGGNIKGALLCLSFAGLCDIFDGTVARHCKRTEDEKHFGIEIDSLSDAVNFGALPVIIFFCMGYTRPQHILIAALYIIGALSRLGYFNLTAMKTEGPVKHYTGLPVTCASMLFPLVWLICPKSVGFVVFPSAYLICAFLFVMKIPFTKPSAKMYPFIAVFISAIIASLVIA